MQFGILGPLEVLDDGRRVAPGGDKQRALLALFLIHANKPLSSELLIDELWGEHPPASAAKTLQVHVSRLRKALEQPAGASGDGVVVTREHGYELRADPDSVDSVVFERLVGEGRRELAAGRVGSACSLLERALSLWRGPALAEFAYERFAEFEAARLEELRIGAREELVEAKLALGRHAEVVGELEGLIAAHPYRERLRAQLMLALYRCDRQAEALQAYQDARRKLVEELGIEPGERLRELERAILAQHPALAFVEQRARTVQETADVSRGVFVGRERELEALAEVAAMSAPGAVVAVVVGEPGSGKSRLLAEACRRSALPHSFAVVGYELERRVPLAAACGLLRALGDVPEHGAQVETLLFDASRAGPLEPVRVFEAAHRAFCQFESLVLVVDDLQWVDELSLALCHYLIRGAEGSGQRLVVFAATRPGGRSVSLVDAVAPERASGIELGPLSREEGIELVLGLDATLDQSLAVELSERAKGSPFWLESLARAGGSVVRLGQVLTVQLRGAGADAASLLALLSVAGRPLSLTDAAALAEWPKRRLAAALQELRDRGLVIEAGGAARLAHDLIREAAVAELPDEVHGRLHRRLAERLEHESGSDLQLLGKALEHRRAARLPTLNLALRLARSAQRKLLGSDGLHLLARIADEADPFDADTLALQEEVARLASDLAEHEAAQARWTLVADRSEAPLRRASALLAASRAAYVLARAEDARDLLARSRQIGVADEILELAQATHDGEIRLWLEHRATEGPALAHHATATAKDLAARAGGVSALDPRGRRAYLDALQLEYEVAVQEADTERMLRNAEARTEAARGFDLESYLAALIGACTALRWAGQVREAERRARSAWTEATRHIFPRLAVDAGEALAGALHVLGELLEAERIARETSELAARAGDLPRARHRVARVACNIALERGQGSAALERLERETNAEQNQHQRIDFHGDVAVWNARLKGPTAAETVREHVAAGRADAAKVGCQRCEAELLLLSAEAFARIGESQDARRLLQEWDRRSGHTNVLADLIRSHVGALADADAAARGARLQSVVAAAEDSLFLLETLWARLDLGLALADARNERAPSELERAAAVAQELGATTVEKLAQRALRSLGVQRAATRGGARAVHRA